MNYTVDHIPIIGLEVHVELKTESKMFCSCSSDHFGKKPNTQVCPVCLGLPGALPVANKKAVEMTVLTGLALNCKISSLSKFDRKNYFYPDLPKGYQISQYDLPLTRNGKWQMPNARPERSRGGKWVRIRRVHLEEDTGKLIHEGGATLIDFNRSGVPLMEIVTEPDITSALQAKTFLQKLQQIVRYLGVSEADMEKGQMRCEPTVNLKIKKDGKTFYTPLVEIKNINSFRFVQKAIEFEISRQLKEFKKTGMEKSPGNKQSLLLRNKTTRGWDEIRQETILQRAKEEAADYRYFPEPDLPPIKWRDKDIKRLRDLLPELPDDKLARFVKEYELSEYNAKILAEIRQTADYFEEAVKVGKKHGVTTKELASVIVNKRLDITKYLPAELVQILSKKKTVPKIAVKKLEKIVEKVIRDNPQAVADYKKGKTQAVEFFLGQVMKTVKEMTDPNQTRKILLEKLGRKK